MAPMAFNLDQSFLLNVALQYQRLSLKKKTIALAKQGPHVTQYIQSLPYTLTSAQQKVIILESHPNAAHHP